MRNRLSAAWLVTFCTLLAGCGSGTNPPPSPPPPPPPPSGPAVTWMEQDIEHEGAEISLGRRGEEPVAAITRDGKPVANAMVFCSPLDGDGKPIGDEAATTYEAAAGNAPPLYVTDPRARPASGPLLIRFRIVLPDAEQEFTRDIAR